MQLRHVPDSSMGERLPARHSPIAADFPLPLAAVSATVDFRVFSEIASKKDRTALAWSNVLASETKFPTLGVSSKEVCVV
jgi:hypothetical protein